LKEKEERGERRGLEGPFEGLSDEKRKEKMEKSGESVVTPLKSPLRVKKIRYLCIVRSAVRSGI